MKFTASNGVPFSIRVIMDGDRYGLNDCLTHDARPMIEFYDARYTGEGFSPVYGQFVSRYFLSTLTNRDHAVGLMLNGGVPEWQVDAHTLSLMLAYAQGIVEARS